MKSILSIQMAIVSGLVPLRRVDLISKGEITVHDPAYGGGLSRFGFSGEGKPDMASEDFTNLVSEAFFYGYPLVADLDEVVRFTKTGMGSVPAAPFNQFSHARTLADPADTFVTINNDTLYSIAQFDLSGGPLFLDVPDSAGRYYVLQFIDAWTNNFAYVGERASGTQAATYFLTPPEWTGTVPDDLTEIRFPTRVASILGRWACSGADDLAGPCAPRQVGAATSQRVRRFPPRGAPPSARRGRLTCLLREVRVWMAAFPPAPEDQSYQERFAAVGLLDTSSPYVDPSADLAKSLTEGLAAAKEKMEAFTRSGTVEKIKGWMSGLHMFDYNLDYFGPGTIDAPEWKKRSRAVAYPERALAARLGLWGNHAYEATYAQTFEDADGAQLNGEHRYQIHFEHLPPVKAFWSLTMYDLPNYYLVANPIDRYSVGDRTPGIKYGDDGSLTITIQHDEPADEIERSNWLPAPEGDFRPILRMYEPGPSILDGSYEIPPITRRPG